MNKTKPFTQLLRQLWQHIEPKRRRQFGLLLILMILASFSEVLSISAVLPFLGAIAAPNQIFEHPFFQPFSKVIGFRNPDEVILPLTIAFGLAALMAGIMRLILLRSSIRFSFAVGADLSNSVYRRTLYQPYAIHIKRNSSEVINGISIKTNEVIFYILMPVLNLISASVMFFAIVMVLASFIPSIALAAVGFFGLLYAFIIRKIRNKLKINSKNIAHESTQTIRYLQEGLGGIRDILTDGTQETFCEIYRSSDQVLRHAQGSNQFMSQSPRFGMEAMGMVLIAGLAYVLTQQTNGIIKVIPVLAALALGLQRLLPALQQAYQAWSTIQGAHVSLQDTLELLDQPLPNCSIQSAVVPVTFGCDISLCQLSFRYSHDKPYVLKNIDLKIKKGSRIGFIGTTGSGKSTLLDIIMGLLQPTGGTINVDGHSITPDNLQSWRKHIAHVPQSVFLTDGNVEENIAFGVPPEQIDPVRVRQAASQAQISDAIESWPLQYKSVVGERGVQLSGGQRQRIGIARALYKNANLIIFDEATSALDAKTEVAAMNAIELLSKDITILIVAHRLSTLDKCDEILEIVNGNLIYRKQLSNE